MTDTGCPTLADITPSGPIVTCMLCMPTRTGLPGPYCGSPGGIWGRAPVVAPPISPKVKPEGGTCAELAAGKPVAACAVL